jgi:hypothetical protein
MNAPNEQTLLDLLLQIKRAPGTIDLPASAPLTQVVAAGVADPLGNFDPRSDDYGRLWGHLTKELFRIEPARLNTAMAFSFRLSPPGELRPQKPPTPPTVQTQSAPPPIVTPDALRPLLAELTEAGFNLRWLDAWCKVNEAAAATTLEPTAVGVNPQVISADEKQHRTTPEPAVTRQVLKNRIGERVTNPGGGSTRMETLMRNKSLCEACKVGGGWIESKAREWLCAKGYSLQGLQSVELTSSGFPAPADRNKITRAV